MGWKVVFWVKKWCFGVFWTKCEVAERKQGQEITTMDPIHKILSLILPTDDPGEAPHCITEYGPYTMNMAIYAINWPVFQNKDFPLNLTLIWPSWCAQSRQIACQPQNKANSTQTSKSTPAGPKRSLF